MRPSDQRADRVCETPRPCRHAPYSRFRRLWPSGRLRKLSKNELLETPKPCPQVAQKSQLAMAESQRAVTKQKRLSGGDELNWGGFLFALPPCDFSPNLPYRFRLADDSSDEPISGLPTILPQRTSPFYDRFPDRRFGTSLKPSGSAPFQTRRISETN